MYIRRNKILIFPLALIVLFVGSGICGCKKQEGQLIKTWDYLREPVPIQVSWPDIEALPPKKALVWGGTVSHHLLADKQIDRWFYEIAQNRKVETFFIISPSHYGLSTQEWSLDDCIWQTKSGMVYTNQKEEKALAEKLGVQYDSQVFPDEHGINTLIPYISRYFPKARVCVITVYGEPPLNQKNAQKLADALQPYFTQKEKKKNFLLISTDFAHHGNLEGTEFKDKRSREFFNNPSDSSWVFCGCDNRPGVYVLSRFLTKQTKSAVLFHTNSYELSGFDEDDITSYFFSFFYD